ncbi:hypothetical protein NDI37_21855 [Funiculus sociatus GB2-A5]|uniref:Uncharacterized protein n=1 Tax=Funiculus sociatus GB2-A5 TaxID=2933946 RepID=A0ABV0JUF9_9CYAN|nr:hypothetical protein [Trichocoleus sp. FACHB-6]MBD2060741.1 hypothetical protein [Trichocoleus sp. FACHB-6]
MKTKRIVGCVGAFLSIVSIVGSAYAVPMKDAAGKLYIDDLTPSGSAKVDFPNALKTINSNTDACGRLIVRNSSGTPLTGVGSILINGTSTPAPTAVDTVPRCLNGVAEVPQTTPYKTPAGDFVFPGLSPLSSQAIAFPGISLSRNVSVNACGFISLTSSAQYPLTGTINVNGTPVNTTTAPMGNPPKCINNVLYTAE